MRRRCAAVSAIMGKAGARCRERATSRPIDFGFGKRRVCHVAASMTLPKTIVLALTTLELTP